VEDIYIQGICACLRDRSRDGTCSKLPDRAGIFIPFWSKILPYKLVSHEIQANLVLPLVKSTMLDPISTDIGSNASHGRNYAPI
jgi:hypothetical protein